MRRFTHARRASYDDVGIAPHLQGMVDFANLPILA